MNVIYQVEKGGPWHLHRCRLSGRWEFDSYEAAYTARKLIRDRKAIAARVIHGTVIKAEFLRNEAEECIQTIGPDL